MHRGEAFVQTLSQPWPKFPHDTQLNLTGETMKTEKNMKCLIVPLETKIAELARAISTQELRSNPRLKRKLAQLKLKVTALRGLTLGPNPIQWVEV
jgi:hypothetical protein